MPNTQPLQDLQGITRLQTVTNEDLANAELKDGWVLLALFDRRDGNNQYTEYHLWWPEDPPMGFMG